MDFTIVDATKNKIDFVIKSIKANCSPTIVIINYELAFRRPELLKLEDFTLLLDESSLIQNEQAKRAKFILKLNAKNVILLSGTPTGGKYEKLWSQLHLLGWKISKKLYWKQYVDTEIINNQGYPITIVKGYKNVGEKVREYCLKFGWGYRVIFNNNLFWFELYKGTDRTSTVIFSDAYENLITTAYVEDETKMGNVALVAGEGQGADRSRNVSGNAESVQRYEIYVDAKDISKTITWNELTTLYPTTTQGGQGYISGNATSGWTYKMNYINIQVIDNSQLAYLQQTYPDGQLITIDNNQYYQIYNEAIADLPSDTPDNTDSVILRDVVYSVYLLTRGYEKLSGYGAVTSFSGTVDPNTTFIYNKDYFLGDLVTIQNNFGISVQARITEVVEVNDDNGYSVEPKFEYITQEG